jgi:hypothetical protein
MKYDEASEWVALVERLEALRAKGAITDEEFRAQKAAWLEDKSKLTVAEADDHAPDWIGIAPPEEYEEQKQRFSRGFGGLAAGLVLIAAVVIYFWTGPKATAEAAATEYSMTGTVNVRSSPSTKGSTILGTLSSGERVKGSLQQTKTGEEWLRISEGTFAQGYVWARNIAPVETAAPEMANNNVENALTSAPRHPVEVAEPAPTSLDDGMTAKERHESSDFCRSYVQMYQKPCPINLSVSQQHTVVRLSCLHAGRPQVLFSCFTAGQYSDGGYVRIRERGRLVEHIDGHAAVSRFKDTSVELGPINPQDFVFEAQTNMSDGMSVLAEVVNNYGQVLLSDQSEYRVRLSSADIR